MIKKTTQLSEDRKLNGIVQMITDGLHKQDKRAILNAYELAKAIDLDITSEALYGTYDKLVSVGNEFLLNEA